MEHFVNSSVFCYLICIFSYISQFYCLHSTLCNYSSNTEKCEKNQIKLHVQCNKSEIPQYLSSKFTAVFRNGNLYSQT